MRIALVMFAAVAVLGVALAAKAITDSAIRGALAVWGIGRFVLMGFPPGEDDEVDLDL